MDLYPAIDLRGGRVVRLRQGAFAAETVYGDDPVAFAVGFADAGASWIHVVDLDAALTGTPTNRPVVAAITQAVVGRARVQTGGGVRTIADVEALAAAGVARVVMGSAAVAEPELVAEASAVADVAVGLDHRGGQVAVNGWTTTTGLRVEDAIGHFPTAAAFVITDISRDGMLAGPDVVGLRSVAAVTPVPVIASGGVGSLADLVALRGVQGLSGVIAGMALYEGRFTVAEALSTLS